MAKTAGDFARRTAADRLARAKRDMERAQAELAKLEVGDDDDPELAADLAELAKLDATSAAQLSAMLDEPDAPATVKPAAPPPPQPPARQPGQFTRSELSNHLFRNQHGAEIKAAMANSSFRVIEGTV